MPNLNTPIKTPYRAVFDMTGNILASNTKNSPIQVVSIRYKYDDEGDDTCNIRLEMSDPKAMDILKITNGSKLQVVWGYIGIRLSPIVTVVIRDMTSKYGENTMYTELVCSDYLSYLKITRSPDVGEGKIIDFIKAQVYGKYNIVIKERGENIYLQNIKKKPEEEKNKLVIDKGYMGPNYSDWDPNTSVDFNKKFPDSFNPIDNEVNYVEMPEGFNYDWLVGKWFVTEDHPVRKFMEESTSIPTSNRSTFMVLQDLFNTCPRGPWFITGRGNTLLIHNRNLGRGIYAEYKYKSEPAQLVDFEAKTNFDNFDKQLISYAGMDPKERQNYFVDDYRTALFNQRTPKEILEDKLITEEKKKEELKNYVDLRLKGYAIFGSKKVEGAFVPGYYRDTYSFLPGHLDKPIIRRLDAQEIAATDNTNNKNPDPFIREDGMPFDPTQHDIALRASWYTFPLLTYNEAVNVTNNRQRELAMEKEEATLIIQGDPWIQSEHTIKVSNVFSQHEGQYYIKKAEHVVSDNGYKTKLDAIKVVPEAKISTITEVTKEEYSKADDATKALYEKQYKREQSLFGANVKVSSAIIYQKSDASFSLPNLQLGRAGELHEVRFDDLLQKEDYSVDQWVDDMIKVSTEPNSKIEFNPENQ